MSPQIKQAKLREEFYRAFPDGVFGILSNPDDRTSPVFVNNELEMERMINWWLNKFSQAKLETLEAIIKEVEGLRGYELGDNPREVRDVWKVGRESAIDDLLTKLQAEKELIENNK